jgi:integrase
MLRLADYFRNTLVAEITGEGIKRAARLIHPSAQPATLNRQVIKPAQAVINYAASLSWCAPIKVARFDEDPKTKTPATLEWVMAFAAQAQADGLPHLGATGMFMFGTAARIGEACALTWGDVDLNAASATIRMGKPKPWTRVAHLPPPVVAALANIPLNRNPDDLVFGYAGRDSLRGAWNNTCARAGIERLTPHCCRHGFATSMLHRGYDPKTVAVRGGWKDATTVMRVYAHAMEDHTVTDDLFDEKLTGRARGNRVSSGKQRGKSQ